MTRIGLLSDTHGYIDADILQYLNGCHEIWHAGDWGNKDVSETIIKHTGMPLKGVFGNIDGPDIRSIYPEKLHFKCEKLNVFMTHIGGYPGKYSKGIKEEIKTHETGLFICGHSHILKIMFDKDLNCLHINPGAAGKQGWQQVRTLVRFSIHEEEILDCEVIELNK